MAHLSEYINDQRIPHCYPYRRGDYVLWESILGIWNTGRVLARQGSGFWVTFDLEPLARVWVYGGRMSIVKRPCRVNRDTLPY